MSRASPLVNARFVRECGKDVHVVDASWHMPATKRNAKEEYKAKRLPGAKFFDIDGVKDAANPAPHMLPSTGGMRAAMEAIGVVDGDDRAIVVYDADGMFSAARAWWMFKVFGREDVYVLDGGAPAYEAAGFEMETGEPAMDVDAAAKACVQAMALEALTGKRGKDYKGERPELVKSMSDVLENIESAEFQLVDARNQARFRGEAAEPRAGVRSGHVPGARNVFFGDLLNADKTFKSTDDIRATFVKSGLDLSGETPIVCSCGTGVTGCILALALENIGHQDVAVYDGSWSEYGADTSAPLAVGEA